MSKKPTQQKKRIQNKRATFDYTLSDSSVLGIVLNGRETKNLRLGHGQLRGAYVTIKDNELWLINATISGSRGIPIEESEMTRTRKLLASKREIERFKQAKDQGKTFIPMEIMTGGRYIKVRVALGIGKKHYDKRESIKLKDINRDEKRHLANYRLDKLR